MADRDRVEAVDAVAARFGGVDESLAVGAQQLQRGALGLRHVAGELDRDDRRALFGLLVEAHRLRSARDHAEQLHALDHPAWA